MFGLPYIIFKHYFLNVEVFRQQFTYDLKSTFKINSIPKQCNFPPDDYHVNLMMILSKFVMNNVSQLVIDFLKTKQVFFYKLTVFIASIDYFHFFACLTLIA